MKISDIYNLNNSKAELDFVDINTNEDLPLFLDPIARIYFVSSSFNLGCDPFLQSI